MPIPDKFYTFPNNDLYVFIGGLFDEMVKTYLNAATVKATLYDPTGNPLPAFTDITLNLVAGSVRGEYHNTVNMLQSLPLGTGYRVLIYGSQGAADFEISRPVEVVKR